PLKFVGGSAWAYAVGFDGMLFGTIVIDGNEVVTDCPSSTCEPTIGPSTFEVVPRSMLAVAKTAPWNCDDVSCTESPVFTWPPLCSRPETKQSRFEFGSQPCAGDDWNGRTSHARL